MLACDSMTLGPGLRRHNLSSRSTWHERRGVMAADPECSAERQWEGDDVKSKCRLFGLTVVMVALLCLGARAGGTGSSSLICVIEGAGSFGPAYLAVDSDGRLFAFEFGSGWSFLDQCPAGRPAHLDVGGRFDRYILTMENGDVFTFPIPPEPPVQFTSLGNVFSEPVGVDAQSWGGIKSGYRK